MASGAAIAVGLGVAAAGVGLVVYLRSREEKGDSLCAQAAKLDPRAGVACELLNTGIGKQLLEAGRGALEKLKLGPIVGPAAAVAQLGASIVTLGGVKCPPYGMAASDPSAPEFCKRRDDAVRRRREENARRELEERTGVRIREHRAGRDRCLLHKKDGTGVACVEMP